MSVASLAARGPMRSVALIAYGALGLPLAFAALPLYVHVPALYAQHFGLPLALVGVALLATRLFDAFSDPLIGWLLDRYRARKVVIAACAPVLAVGMLMLLAPPAQRVSAGWLILALLLCSLAYSVFSLAYLAWGTELRTDAQGNTRVSAWREGFGLAGVVLASSLPAWLGGGAAGMAQLAWVFCALLAGVVLLSLTFTPDDAILPGAAARVRLRDMMAALCHAGFRRLLVPYAISGLAAAIPASLVMFYVGDVLGLPERAGLYLALYFLAAAAGLPCWVRVAQRVGKTRAWAAGMVLAVASFVWAGLLGVGDGSAFAVICVLSGLALGADLAMPPALLADLVARPGAPAAGVSFGWWNFVAKLNLALAAGLVLPMLAALGYRPGEGAADGVLAMVYAGVPAVLKLLAMCVLWRNRSGEA